MFLRKEWLVLKLYSETFSGKCEIMEVHVSPSLYVLVISFQGIFPCSFVHLKPCKIENEGYVLM